MFALQAVIHGMLFAFIYLLLQKCQVLSESKGEPLLPPKISNLLLSLSIFSFVVRYPDYVSQNILDICKYVLQDYGKFCYVYNLSVF